MCLIVFGVDPVPGIRLVVAANRDEFYQRETQPLHPWPDAPIVGGRDAQAGGTWMGVGTGERLGRFAAVTNVRDGEPVADPDKLSRGELPVDFLVGELTPEEAAQALVATADRYAPVNLLVADATSVWWATNWPKPQMAEVGPGVHAVSNGSLDNDWPKVVDTREALAARLAEGAVSIDAVGDALEPIFEILADDRPAEDSRLPDTGIGREREVALSSPFIRIPDMYGTRASTVLRMRTDGHGAVTERRFDQGEVAGETSLHW